jgi:predicted AAA+ superfamily ATPase
MEHSKLERIVLDQQEELNVFRTGNYCLRKEETLIDLNSNLAQVVIGVRRSGKSTLCINVLERAKVRYAYVNFDDERLLDISVDDMDPILEVLYKIYGDFTHLLLDEVQNVNGWHLFVNRMLRNKMHIVLTGSNSKLLSGELASHLTGRHHQIELLPFSFADFCSYEKVPTSPLTTKNRGFLASAFDKYMKQGGFPELMNEKDSKSYIDSLLEDIIKQDIKKRFNVKYVDTLMHLTNHLLNEAPSIIVKDTLQNLFNISSSHTLGNYLSYLEQTYLISTLSKYSAKSRQRVRNAKYYAIDVAFMNQRKDAFSGDNMGFRLETIVYLELKRRTKYARQDVYYHAVPRSECDFVVCDGNQTIAAYQVSYDISSPKTYNREINGCIAGAKGTHCENLYLLTYNEAREPVLKDGHKIKIMPVWEWLLLES